MGLIVIRLILILCLVSEQNFEPNSTCNLETPVGRDAVSVSFHFKFTAPQRLRCPYAHKNWDCQRCAFGEFIEYYFELLRTFREPQESSNESTSSSELFIYLGYFEFLLERFLKFEKCCFAGDQDIQLGDCHNLRYSEQREQFAGIASNEIKDIIKVIERIMKKLKHVYVFQEDMKCFNAELLVSSLITQPKWSESDTWREILLIGSIVRRILRGECIELLKMEQFFTEDTFLQYENDCQHLNIDRGFTEILTDLQMNREGKYAESRNQTPVCNVFDITSNLQKNVCSGGNMTNLGDVTYSTFQYRYLKIGDNETSPEEDSLTDAVHLKLRKATVLKCWTSQDLMQLFDINPRGNIYRADFRRLCPVLIQQRLSAVCISNRNMNTENLVSKAAKSAVSGLYSCLSVFLLSVGSLVNAFVFKKVKPANYQQWISVLFALSFATMMGHVAAHIAPVFSGLDDDQELKEFSWSNAFPESMLLQLTCTVVLSSLIIFRSYIICKGIEKRLFNNTERTRDEELCEAVSRAHRMFSSEPDWRSEISLDFPNESTESYIFEPVLNEGRQEPLYFINYVLTEEEISTTSDTLPGTSIKTSSMEMIINSEGAESVSETPTADISSCPGTSMETSYPETIINSEDLGSVPEISAADFSSDNETLDRVTVRRRMGSPTFSYTEAVDANQATPQSSIKRWLARYIPEFNPNVVGIFTADVIHNFADGMMINLLFTQSFRAGLWGILAVALHEFSHEAANILKLQSIMLPFKKVLWINAIASVSSTLGIILCMILQTAWRTGAQAVIYGIFVNIIINHLIPELRMSLKDKYDRKLFVKNILAICCGIATMMIIRVLQLKQGQL